MRRWGGGRKRVRNHRFGCVSAHPLGPNADAFLCTWMWNAHPNTHSKNSMARRLESLRAAASPVACGPSAAHDTMIMAAVTTERLTSGARGAALPAHAHVCLQNDAMFFPARRNLKNLTHDGALRAARWGECAVLCAKACQQLVGRSRPVNLKVGGRKAVRHEGVMREQGRK